MVIIVSSVFSKIGTDQTGIQALTGITFLVIMETTFPNMTAVLNIFPRQSPLVLREIRSDMYRVLSYYFSHALLLVRVSRSIGSKTSETCIFLYRWCELFWIYRYQDSCSKHLRTWAFCTWSLLFAPASTPTCRFCWSWFSLQTPHVLSVRTGEKNSVLLTFWEMPNDFLYFSYSIFLLIGAMLSSPFDNATIPVLLSSPVSLILMNLGGFFLNLRYVQHSMTIDCRS